MTPIATLTPFVLAHEAVGVEAVGLSPALIVYSTLAALALLTVALRVTMSTPMISGAERSTLIERWPGDGLPVLAQGALRAVGLAGLGFILVCGWFGSEQVGANPIFIAMFIVFWVGGQLLAVIVGDWWRLVDPFDTIGAAVARRARPTVGYEEDGEGEIERTDADRGDWWVPAALLASFSWLWVAWIDGGSKPRIDAAWLTLYTLVMIAGAVAGGRAWVRRNEAFGIVFGLIAAASPVDWQHGRPRLRNPLRSLATLDVGRREAAVMAVVTGTVLFDAVGSSRWWADLVGLRSLTLYSVINTFGFLVLVLLAAVVWVTAARFAATLGRDEDPDALTTAPLALAGPLVLLVVGATLAHDFGSLLVNGQNLLALLSDPLAQGWDVLGTAQIRTNPDPITPETEVVVALVLLEVALMAAAVGLHDRCVARFGLRGGASATWAMLGFSWVAAVATLVVVLGV